MSQATTTTAPGVTVYQTRQGPLQIQSAYPVKPIAEWAWQARGKVTITNTGFQPVYLTATLVATDPQLHPTVQPSVSVKLAPGKAVTLPASPPGWAWSVVDLTAAQLRTIGWGVILGGATVLGLAGYGTYAAGANLYHWIKRRRAQRMHH